jgi:hypothetical protein
MCYPSLVMLEGRCSCAISGRPTPISARKSQLTPLFPLHPRNAPVSPFFPLHTQKQGGGDASCKMCSPITLLFCSTPLTTQVSTIVGAPTFAYPNASAGMHDGFADAGLEPRMLGMTKVMHLQEVGTTGHWTSGAEIGGKVL